LSSAAFIVFEVASFGITASKEVSIARNLPTLLARL